MTYIYGRLITFPWLKAFTLISKLLKIDEIISKNKRNNKFISGLQFQQKREKREHFAARVYSLEELTTHGKGIYFKKESRAYFQSSFHLKRINLESAYNVLSHWKEQCILQTIQMNKRIGIGNELELYMIFDLSYLKFYYLQFFRIRYILWYSFDYTKLPSSQY